MQKGQKPDDVGKDAPGRGKNKKDKKANKDTLSEEETKEEQEVVGEFVAENPAKPADHVE
eukprot:6361686-Amphidinium_carterae.1